MTLQSNPFHFHYHFNPHAAISRQESVNFYTLQLPIKQSRNKVIGKHDRDNKFSSLEARLDILP